MVIRQEEFDPTKHKIISNNNNGNNNSSNSNDSNNNNGNAVEDKNRMGKPDKMGYCEDSGNSGIIKASTSSLPTSPVALNNPNTQSNNQSFYGKFPSYFSSSSSSSSSSLSSASFSSTNTPAPSYHSTPSLHFHAAHSHHINPDSSVPPYAPLPSPPVPSLPLMITVLTN